MSDKIYELHHLIKSNNIINEVLGSKLYGRIHELGLNLNNTFTEQSNLGNYSPSERMKASFRGFESRFGGKVFIVFSKDGEIDNKEVLGEIRKEIERLW
jgi:hypothetical protein